VPAGRAALVLTPASASTGRLGLPSVEKTSTVAFVARDQHFDVVGQCRRQLALVNLGRAKQGMARHRERSSAYPAWLIGTAD
jgi:hypothetical protein